MEKECKQPRIDEVIKTPKLFSKDLFEEILIKWVVKNDQPFTEVESIGFRKLLTLLKPNLEIMSADTIKRRINDKFETRKSEMRLLLGNLDSKVLPHFDYENCAGIEQCTASSENLG